MKTFSHLLLCAAALIAPGAKLARADDSAPLKGKVLVLENERVLEGDVERVGDQFRVHRAVGETWVPGEKVVRLCQNMEEAYQFLRGRANLEDADERLRLATWCRQNGLREQALSEVKAAAELRPQHAPTRRLLASLQQTTPPVQPTHRPPSQGNTEPANLPSIDVSSDAVNLFSTKVQPILMNACANCHASGRGGAFKLTRAYDGGPNSKNTQLNLVAVLAELDPERPQVSKFLTKAVSAHGNGRELTNAPLRGRDTPAFHTLEGWVQLTVANNPQLRDHAAEPSAERKPTTPSSKSEPVRTEEPTAFAAPTDPKPTPPPAEKTTDPYDPDEFNKANHPGKVAPAPKP
jgi:hypothetical protein